MKTKLFNAWTELLECFLVDIATLEVSADDSNTVFLKDVSNKKVSYDNLSTWMDTEGFIIFQGSQAKYFEEHKSQYLQDADTYPPPVRIDLAYGQIAYGFDKLFENLVDKFPSLKKDCINDRYTAFKRLSLGEAFLPFIAARATMTGQMVRANEPNRLKNLDHTIEAFEFLASASRKSVESMNEFRPKVQSAISRGPSSPLLHNEKQEVTTEKNRHTTDNSMTLKHQ